MELIVLLVLWGISIPLCINSAKRIGGSKIVAGMAGFVAPILAPIGYMYVASHSKGEKIQTKEIWKDILIIVGVIILIYLILNPLFN